MVECWLNIKQSKLTSEDELRLFYVSNKTYVVVLFNSLEELLEFILDFFYVECRCYKSDTF